MIIVTICCPFLSDPESLFLFSGYACRSLHEKEALNDGPPYASVIYRRRTRFKSVNLRSLLCSRIHCSKLVSILPLLLQRFEIIFLPTEQIREQIISLWLATKSLRQQPRTSPSDSYSLYHGHSVPFNKQS